MFRLNSSPLLLLLLIFGVFSCSVHSLRFELLSGHTKCLAEDIRINAMSVGYYNITNPHPDQPLPDSHTVSVSVSSRSGNKIYHQSENVQSGQFAFVAEKNGDHMACFWVTHQKPQISVTVDFNWRTGVAARDWSNVPKKSDVDEMVQELHILQEVASSIIEDITYLRKQEHERELNNWTTNSRMFWLSMLSLLICLSVAGLQLWHLKTFFEKKKIL